MFPACEECEEGYELVDGECEPIPTTPPPTTPPPTTAPPTTAPPTTPPPTTAPPPTEEPGKPLCCLRIQDAIAFGPIPYKFIGIDHHWGWVNIATKREIKMPIFALDHHWWHKHHHDDNVVEEFDPNDLDPLVPATPEEESDVDPYYVPEEHDHADDIEIDHRLCSHSDDVYYNLTGDYHDHCDHGDLSELERERCHRKLHVGTVRIKLEDTGCVNVTITSVDCRRRYHLLDVYVGNHPPKTAHSWWWGHRYNLHPTVSSYSVCIPAESSRPQWVAVKARAATCWLHFHRHWWHPHSDDGATIDA